MEKEIFKFKLEIEIPDLDKFDPLLNSSTSQLKYDAELIIDIANKHDVLLKIFFDPNEDLNHKVGNYILKEDLLKSERFLDKIKFIDSINPFDLININFTGHSFKSIFSKSLNDIKLLDIKTTGVNLFFSVPEPDNSVFYLNSASFDLIELNFDYTKHFSFQNENYKWEPIPKLNDFLEFNKVWYKPDFNIFNTNNTTEKITITKEPIIKFLYNDLNHLEIKKHIQAICALFSFYSGKDVNYQYSSIYFGHTKYVEVKNIPNSYSDYNHSMFKYDIRNPTNLIASVNALFVLENLDFVINCIRRFNQALQLEGESKFMLLYNLIEQIRNHHVRTHETSIIEKVIDSYQFTENKKANELIKKSLNDISECVIPEMKDSFLDEISSKTKEIKRLTMKNQFTSLFKYLKIKPENYQLDFKTLFVLRNEIFHGNQVSDIKMLDQVNTFQCLPKFTGMILLKFMGVNDLKDIKKVVN